MSDIQDEHLQDIEKENEKKEVKDTDITRTELEIIIPESTDAQCDQRLIQFIPIKDNIYLKLSNKVICKVNKTMKCDCTITEEELKNGEMGCRYKCINRLLFIECSSKCRCGEFCDNQQFQRYNYSPISVFQTEKKGFGLRADDNIPRETFIIEFVGEVLNKKQFEKRAKKYLKDKNRHDYSMTLRSNAVIDATVKGNISRFINHSCDPNAMTQKWIVNGEVRVGFFSIRDIRRGEEITFDYECQKYRKEAQKCYCESENCRGWIVKSKAKVEEKADVGEEPLKQEHEEEPKKQNEEIQKLSPSEKENIKKVEKKLRKRQDLLKDLEIEEEIYDLTKCGLKNRANTIRFARLVVRAKNTDARSRLLKILISGEFPCRRLFLDYNGLKLLNNWMCDVSIKSSIPDIWLCIELMHALDLLPITNKTVLRDSKILERVEKWKNLDLEKKKLTKEEKKQAKADKKKNKAAGKLQQYSLEQIKNDKTILVRTFDVLEELSMTKLILKETAYELLKKWEVLKEDFRIPKKKKQEIMIEHEREAGIEDWEDNCSNNSLDNIDYYKNRYNVHTFTSNNNRSFNFSYEKSFDPTKIQHNQQMSALKVAQNDMEARMKELHENNCALFGLSKNVNPLDIPINVNRVTGEFLNILGAVVPNPPNYHNFKYDRLTVSTNPDDYHLQPMDLPEKWKFAIDKFGRIYYYHELIRQPQWEPPIKILPLNSSPDEEDDSEIDSDESETETEDEEEEELLEMLRKYNRKKQIMHSQLVNLSSQSGPQEQNTDDDLEVKIMNDMLSNPPDQAIELSHTPPTEKLSKKKGRNGLSTMIFIRPRTEEDKLYGRTETKRYKEVKEQLKRDKKRRILQGEPLNSISDEDEENGDSSLNESRMVDELDILKKSKQLDKIRKIKKDLDSLLSTKESHMDPDELKKQQIKPVLQPINLNPTDQSAIKIQFRDEIKEVVTKFLLPYRENSCINGRITTEEDYISLINKLTFSVLTKESKHCSQSNRMLKATETVKRKTKEYIKKYMSKFEGPYQRKPDEQDYTSILRELM